MKQNISVLVHNSIVGDSRVLRAASALAEDGHQVTCFGIGKLSDEFRAQSYPFEIVLQDAQAFTNMYTGAQRLARYILGVGRRISTALHSPNSASGGSRKMDSHRHEASDSPPEHTPSTTKRSVREWILAELIILRQSAVANILLQVAGDKPFDVIYCHDIPALIAGRKLKAKNPNTKLVWDAHEIYDDLGTHAEGRSMAMKKIIKASLPAINRFITINKNIADYYQKNYCLSADAIVLNSCELQPGLKSTSPLLNAIGAKAGERILLYQGGFSSGRGIEKLLEAAILAPKGWRFVFMGEGPLKEPLLSEAKRSEDKGFKNINVLGSVPRSELESWSAGADLGAIPYPPSCMNHLYCTPNKLWEYPAAGVPIIATDLEEITQRITAHGCGLTLHSHWTPQDLINALQGITAKRFEDLQQGCISLMRQEAYTEHVKPKLLEVFKD